MPRWFSSNPDFRLSELLYRDVSRELEHHRSWFSSSPDFRLSGLLYRDVSREGSRPPASAPARLIVFRLPRQRYDVAGEAGGSVYVQRAGVARHPNFLFNLFQLF
ncbi:MAG: hypothetical protein KJ666_04610 [Bacteroidetes bacterium]|nr:hypothetical protein [Bacteroidota bacterium]